ncbi:hypothetical protein [Engelhardtia mirabilis]|uniref:hypothetical protein n=1 Tax=Engelhardtia mirabilis TaxID=2528011 RepID=UPI0011A6FD2A
MLELIQGLVLPELIRDLESEEPYRVVVARVRKSDGELLPLDLKLSAPVQVAISRHVPGLKWLSLDKVQVTAQGLCESVGSRLWSNATLIALHETEFESGQVATILVDVKRGASGERLELRLWLNELLNRWEVQGKSSPAARFAQGANLAISLSLATLLGVLLLFRRARLGGVQARDGLGAERDGAQGLVLHEYQRLAVAIWLVFWVLMAAAWLSLYLLEDWGVMLRSVMASTLDNLNAITLVVIYFVVTRGNQFRLRRAVYTWLLLSSIVVGYLGVVYSVFRLNPAVAFRLHESFSLCLGFLSPIVLGWAFYLRFGTSAILVIGVAYGLAQPFVYSSEISAYAAAGDAMAISSYRPAIAMVLALLKVVWGVAVLAVLFGWPVKGRTTANLVTPLPVHPIEDNGSRSNFLGSFTSFPNMLLGAFRSNRDLAVYTGLAGAIYLGLATRLGVLYVDSLMPLAIAIGVVAGLLTILQVIASVMQMLSATAPDETPRIPPGLGGGGGDQVGAAKVDRERPARKKAASTARMRTRKKR